MCGCGGDAGYYTATQRDYKKGDKRKFLRGHNARVAGHTSGQFTKGRKSGFKGVPISKRHQDGCKCSVCLVKDGYAIGATHPAWNGGLSRVIHRVRAMNLYKEWRTRIYERDKYTCVMCGDSKSYLNADHNPMGLAEILRKFNIDTTEKARTCDKLWDINNGRTLCVPCHSTTPSYKKRNYYEK